MAINIVKQDFYSYFTRKKPIILSSWYGTKEIDPWKRYPLKITVNPYPEHAEGLRGYLHILHLWWYQTESSFI